MRMKGLSVASLIISSAIVLSACAGGGGAETTSSGSGTTNSAAQATPVAAALDAPFQATDLNQLPDTAKKRTDTIIVGLTDPVGLSHHTSIRAVMMATLLHCFLLLL